MRVPVYNLSGEEVKKINISEQVFDLPFNQALVHQAVVRQRANARQGTASTKTRSEVRGSTRKLFRQKGTGFARAGSKKSPLRRGGGITFGPKPRNYRQAMPRKMRQLALKCVLSEKVRASGLKVLEQLTLDQPKTKEMMGVLEVLKIDSSALIVTSEPEGNVVKAARNLPGVKALSANLLNVVDIISHKMILMTVPAVRKAEELWGKNPKEESDGSVRSATPSNNN